MGLCCSDGVMGLCWGYGVTALCAVRGAFGALSEFWGFGFFWGGFVAVAIRGFGRRRVGVYRNRTGTYRGSTGLYGTGPELIGVLLGFMGPERDLSGFYWGLLDRTGTYRGSIGVLWGFR